MPGILCGADNIQWVKQIENFAPEEFCNLQTSWLIDSLHILKSFSHL